jgi:hypothetical protein
VAAEDYHNMAYLVDDDPNAQEAEGEARMANVVKSVGKLKAVPDAPKKKTKPNAEDTGDMALPTAKTSPVATLTKLIILLFGERKIGKTSMLARADRTLFLMFEPGDKALSLHRLPAPPQGAFERWSEFKKAVSLLAKDRGKHFDLVVIDVVDLAFKLCEKYVCKKLDVEHVSEASWGKGWGTLRDEFAGEVNRLLAAGYGVVFISHATEREIKTRQGNAYDMIVSTMPKMAREMIEGLVDVWAYYGYDGQRRVLHIQGSDHIAAGHRLRENFRWQGKPVREIDMGDSEESAWTNFTNCFQNRYEPTTKKRREPETETPRKAVKKLKKVS